MSDRKSLSVSAPTHQQLERLGTKFSLSHKDLIGLMAQYFTVTKADPRDLKADVPDVAIKKLIQKVDTLDKRVIAFIREQEKELLKPILSEVKAIRTQISPDPTRPGGSNALTADQLEEQLTGVVEAMQQLLQISFRAALVDNALRAEYKEQADALIREQNKPAPKKR